MPRAKDEKLTTRQINNLRAMAARRLPQILRRLSETAAGECAMSKESIAAAKTLLDKVLPSMQHLETEEHAPDRSPQEVYADLAKALQTDTHLQDALGVIPKHMIAEAYSDAGKEHKAEESSPGGARAEKEGAAPTETRQPPLRDS